MSDDAVKYAVAAITAGFTVCDDPGGRFKFWNDDVIIIYRCHEWVAKDIVYTDPNRHYPDLLSALESEGSDN